jgi:GR25 family glycosyltransferase involved in LPS biosynthesis
LGRVATYTGLQIDVIEPVRPDATTIEDFLNLGSEKSAKSDRGSTIAWLGHLAVLQNMVASDFQTALIMEDDVDFDVTIKSQIRRLANAIQLFTNTSHNTSPYGTAWEVLWLGHCGERWDRARSSLQYPDSSRIQQEQYIGWKETSFEVIRDDHRLVQWAAGPTCTFAYAVTSAGATKILDLASKGRSTAFDTELSALCVFGKLKCITVMPQLFVHYVPHATGGEYVSEVEIETKNGDRSIDDSHLDLAMGQTQNIVKSARCMAMFGKGCLPGPG